MTVELDNGMRFLNNFKYTVKTDISKNPQNESPSKFMSFKTGDYKYFDSHCDETMVGFVQTMPLLSKEQYSMTNHKVVCFYGKQVSHYDFEKAVQVKTEADDVKVAVITAHNDVKTEPLVPKKPTALAQSRSRNKRINAHFAHVASDETDRAIDFINTANLGWKADTCKLQKNHPNYGAHCNRQNFHALAQVEQSLEMNQGQKLFGTDN